MGTLTFLELQDEVRASLGGRTELDSRLPRIINLAQQRLARIHDFDEMEVLSIGTIYNTGNDSDKYLTLPNKREVYSLVLVDGANSRKLIQRTPQFWDKRLPLPEYWARDRLQDYVVWSNTIEVWPLPNADYTLRLRWSKWPTDLSSDSDVSEFLQKDEILIELALLYIFRSLGKEEDANKHAVMLQSLLAEATANDDTKPDISIIPSASDIQTLQGGLGDTPWLNPFIRST